MQDTIADQQNSDTPASSWQRLFSITIVLACLGAANSALAQGPGYGSDFGARHALPAPGWGTGQDWETGQGWEERRGQGFHRHGGFPHHRPYPYPRRTSWIQRPYPYHLDYYKMRYGGSYAPYFGNLYGPPSYYLSPGYYGGVYYY